MSQRDKLLKSLENNPNNVSFETLKNLLLSSGFKLRSVKGSHHTFKKENGEQITIPHHKPVKAYYVKLALKAIKGD